jgi:hypothetical protein
MRAVDQRGQRGQALSEFAIAGTILITLLVGLAQMGVIYYALLSVQSGSREGARVASENPGDTGLFSGANSPTSPGSHTCTGTGDPIKACKAVFNSTHGGAAGGLITPANMTVTLTGSTFPGSTGAKCPGNTGTTDGQVKVVVSYNAPIFVPLLGSALSTAGNGSYRTVTSTVQTRVEPCINTNGG